MNKICKLLVIIVLSALLTSCVAEWGSVFTQECPGWSSILQEDCEVQQGFVEQEYTVRLDNWDQIKLQVQGRMIVNDPINVIFYEENGTIVDPTTTIFTAGTYYVHRIDEGVSASFIVTVAEKNDSGSDIGTFSLTMDLVRPAP